MSKAVIATASHGEAGSNPVPLRASGLLRRFAPRNDVSHRESSSTRLGIDRHLQGRVMVYGAKPTPNGLVPTATVATTLRVAVRITETLPEPPFAT